MTWLCKVVAARKALSMSTRSMLMGKLKPAKRRRVKMNRGVSDLYDKQKCCSKDNIWLF